MSFTILNANANQIPLAAKSVQCVVTSPPYWGLRDYGQVGQIGLEATPEAYVEKIVAVFAEVWRVLRDDGTCWVNLGDSYAQMTTRNRPGGGPLEGGRRRELWIDNDRSTAVGGLKPKDLCGVPWRVAFALQAAGWYLRSDIIWSKPNPMPESVTDRPTKAHEYIFLLTKKERYYFDQDAVRETAVYGENRGTFLGGTDRLRKANVCTGGLIPSDIDTARLATINRNIRTVWEIATQPYPEAHFATFPEEIAIRCIKAGTSEKGACKECGAPWERVTEANNIGKISYNEWRASQDKARWKDGGYSQKPGAETKGGSSMQQYYRDVFGMESPPSPKTIGWQQTCKHDAPTVPCTVLDIFSGAGTVPLVADKLNRRGIGLELKWDYVRMAHDRCYDDAPLLSLAN